MIRFAPVSVIGPRNALYGILVLASLSACTGQAQKRTGERILEVQLEVSAPFSTALLRVLSEGKITYEAEAPRAGIEKRTDSAEITDQEFDALAQRIVENDFWSFEERYAVEGLADATTYTVTVQSVSTYAPELADARVRSVRCYGECPRQITEIIDAIKNLWGKEILEVGV